MIIQNRTREMLNHQRTLRKIHTIEQGKLRCKSSMKTSSGNAMFTVAEIHNVEKDKK